MPTPHDLTLYFITDPQLCAARGVVETARAAARGGATLVQLRDPHGKAGTMVETARALVAALAPFGVPLIVNDRPDVALAAGAAGVHVGQDDLPVEAVRAMLGPEAIVGLSAGSEDEIARVPWGLVDHIGVGPVFATATKGDAGAALGLDRLAALVARARKPAVAIGGIGMDGAAGCIAAGAAGVAVVSVIASAEDPESAARGLRGRIASGRSRA